jgi:nitrogen fixation protein FixH
MKTILSLALASFTIASSATATFAASKPTLSVAAVFQPNPPKQGTETILVTVKDAAGKPVKGAVVTVGSNMPTMSMSGPTAKARDNGNGTYTAKTEVNFATKWTFDVEVAAKGRKARTQLSADVK